MLPSDISARAQHSFDQFVLSLYRLLVPDGLSFDAILVSGNTGLAMARLTQLIYEQLAIQAPPVIKTSIHRRGLFDNSVLELDIRNQLRDARIDAPRRILFVDDELGRGITVRTCVDLLKRAQGARPPLEECYILSETKHDHYDFSELAPVRFRIVAFARHQGINNLILHTIPPEIDAPLAPLGEDLPVRFNLLLGLPSRRWGEPLAGFSYQVNYRATREVQGLPALKEDFQGRLTQRIARLLSEAQRV